MISKVNDICNKDGSTSQEILQLFDDKCFKLVKGADVTGSFCLDDFAFPSDGHICMSMNIEMGGGEELTLFDNEILTVGSPASELEMNDMYVRGIIIKITYPVNDDDGEEIDITDKSVELWIEDAATLQYKKYSLYNLFSIFTNPKSNDPSDLINRIKIVNPNELFDIKVDGLIIYGKVQ
jgi:hypothetical protein